MDLLLFMVAILVLPQTYALETYENSSNLCDRCKCTNGSKFILDCQNEGFHHMIANWPPHSTELIATFSHNNFSNLEVLPDSDLVTQVVLSHCGIQSLDNGAFKAVKNIKYLDLSYNILTTEEIAPEKFKGPYNDSVYEPLAIEHLDVSYNQIHSLPHNIFEHLIALKELNLEGNNLRILDHPTQMSLSGLKHLQVLNLAKNDLTELVGDAIRDLQNLRVLNLALNKLDFVPETLSLLENSLEAVYLDNNLIFEITSDSFLGVKGIRTLSLTNLPRLQYIKANAFAPLHNLKILYLCDNLNLTTIDRDAIGQHQALEELYMHNNSLQDLHYNLTNWSSLKILTLTGNNFICDCDLYKISQELSWQIKRNKDGAFCINPITDTSVTIYSLTEEICEYEQYSTRYAHLIQHHFNIIRLVLIISSVVLTLTTAAGIMIAFLKYRRYRMNFNYPFVAQVMYNPLRMSNPN